MSFLLIIVIFTFPNTTPLSIKIKNLKFKEQTIYLIQRGTTGKLGNFVKEFNIKNKYASHLGIGFVKDHQLMIYHVYIEKDKNENYLYIENIDDFIKPKDLNYISIWQLNNINNEKFIQIKNTLIHTGKDNILFDFDFDKSDKKYYCSEYVVKELRRNNIVIMAEYQKKVKGIANQMLKKDIITYFPVDGFETTNKAKKIFEWIK